jgi:hypothetical protein
MAIANPWSRFNCENVTMVTHLLLLLKSQCPIYTLNALHIGTGIAITAILPMRAGVFLDVSPLHWM